MSREDYKAWAQVKPLGEVPESTDIGADLLKLMASPDLASRAWIWQQYDSQAMADTLPIPGGDAGVVRVHGTHKALAMTTDCTPRYCYADPYEGGKQAVAEAYRNLCAVGARPLAVTNCLNFGNPERPEIMAQFVGCLEGMGDACRALDFPIVSGNVSLYNESKATGGGSAILPTPAIGGVGLLDDYRKMATVGFKAEGEAIWLIDTSRRFGTHLGQSLWLREIAGQVAGDAPHVELAAERLGGDFMKGLVADGKATAVHDVSDGGVLIAIAEMALGGNLGCSIDYKTSDWAHSDTAMLFGEDQNRFIVTALPSEMIGERAERAGVTALRIGNVGGDRLIVESPTNARVSLADLRVAHDSFFRKWMEG